MKQNFEVVPAPSTRPSRMPQESQYLLKAFLGLEKGKSVRFKCVGYNDAFLTSKALLRFIYDARKSGKLSERLSVMRTKEGGRAGITKPITEEDKSKRSIWYVFVGRKRIK